MGSDLMSFTVVCVFMFFTLTTVSGQVPVVTAFKGGHIQLPCVYKGKGLPEHISFQWRDNDDRKVLVVIESSSKLNSQNQVFKDRVESFPDVYKHGNFSIVLKNVQESDSGTYICNFPGLFSTKVQLSVSGERAAAASTSTPAPGSSGAAVEVQVCSLLLCLFQYVM